MVAGKRDTVALGQERVVTRFRAGSWYLHGRVGAYQVLEVDADLLLVRDLAGAEHLLSAAEN